MRFFLSLIAALILAFPVLAQDAENVLVIEIAGEANGTIEIELFPDLAPGHVARIKDLARAGQYDNVAFHRVIPGFMAQTGDVKYGTRENFGSGRAGFGSSDLPDLPAEFSDAKHIEGVVSMARANDPNSANSQFFIMFDEAPFLDGQYTVFGRVVTGMDVVHEIRKGDESQNGVVPEPDFMTSVRVKSDL